MCIAQLLLPLWLSFMMFNSLLVSNTFKLPSTICLFATNYVRYVFQAFVVPERPTRCVVPAMAFPKQLGELDLRYAGSLSGIEFA